MTPRQLKYFVAISRAGSITSAAKVLRIAQPALSQHIAAMEEEIGVPLLSRHPRGVKLTAEGQRLLERANSILYQLDELKQDVRRIDGKPSGPVALSVAGALATTLAVPLFRRLDVDFPEIRLRMSTGMSMEVRELLESRRVDLAVLPSAFEIPGLHYVPVYEEDFCLFGAAGSFGDETGPIRFAEIGARPLVEPDRDHDLRKLIERTAIKKNRPINVRYEINNAELTLAIVREGLAFAIMPRSACADVERAGVTARAIRGPRITRVQSLTWRSDQPLTPAAKAVAGALPEVIGQLVQQGRLLGRLIQLGK